MEEKQIIKWRKVKAALGAAGKTDCYFYQKACVGIQGKDLDVFKSGLTTNTNN
jgi:hypothetical protein